MKLKGLLIICLAFLWLSGMVAVIASSVGYTPLRLSAFKKLNTFIIMPQGWGFFTRNPREEFLTLYEIKKEKTPKLLTQPNFSYVNAFGLSRRSRTRQMELGLIISSMGSYWSNCESTELINCPKDTLVNVKSSFDKPLLRGNYMIKKQRHIPWAWSRRKHKITTSYKVLRIHVE